MDLQNGEDLHWMSSLGSQYRDFVLDESTLGSQYGDFVLDELTLGSQYGEDLCWMILSGEIAMKKIYTERVYSGIMLKGLISKTKKYDIQNINCQEWPILTLNCKSIIKKNQP